VLPEERGVNSSKKEVSADKVYLSHKNLRSVELAGGMPFTPFKSNTLQRIAMILTRATSLFRLLHPIASIVSQGGPPE